MGSRYQSIGRYPSSPTERSGSTGMNRPLPRRSNSWRSTRSAAARVPATASAWRLLSRTIVSSGMAPYRRGVDRRACSQSSALVPASCSSSIQRRGGVRTAAALVAPAARRRASKRVAPASITRGPPWWPSQSDSSRRRARPSGAAAADAAARARAKSVAARSGRRRSR